MRRKKDEAVAETAFALSTVWTLDNGQYVSLSSLSPLLSPLSYKFIAKFEEALSELHRHLHHPLLVGEFIKYCCIQD